MDRRLPTRAGFSLLELIVVVALTAILLAIAVPRVSASLPGVWLDQAARSLAAELRLARVRAVSQNARVRLIVELGRGEYRTERDAEGVYVVERSHALSGGIRFDTAGSSRVVDGRVSITFQPRGNTANNSTIALQSTAGASRRVIVSTAGRVRIQ